MLKKIKENPKYQKFRELWANEKTHSLITLGLWMTFIIIVILFVRLSSTPVNTENQTEDTPNQTQSLNKIKSYEFTYVTPENEYNGQAYDDKMLFYLNNKKYYVNQNVYLFSNGVLQKELNYDLNIMKINIPMLDNLLQDTQPSQIGEEKQYIIPLDKFMKLLDPNQTLPDAINYNILINITEKDSTISKITIDLSNYMTLKNKTKTNYQVTMYLYNINNVSDFTKEYDKMIGGE
jgi:hypothetical protein